MQSYNVVRIISLWRLLKITLTEASVAYCMTSTQVAYWSHCFKKKCISLVRNIWSNSVFQNSIPKKVFFGSTICNLNEEKSLPRKWLPKFSEVFERATFWNMRRLTCFQSYKFTSFSGWSLLVFFEGFVQTYQCMFKRI